MDRRCEVDDQRWSSGKVLTHPNPLVRWGVRAWLLLGMFLLAWLLWRLAGNLRLVISPLVVALFPAGMFMPVVDWLVDRGWNRGLASLLATVTFMVALVGILVLLGWQVSQELSGLTDQLASEWDNLRSMLGDPSWMPANLTAAEVAQSAADSAGSGEGGGGEAGGGSGGLGSVVVLGRSLAELVAQTFLGLVALFFYLRDRDRIARFLSSLFPAKNRDDAREIGRRTWQTVTDYIRGQSIVAVVDGVLFAIGLMIIGVPLAWVLGAIVAIGAFVPVIGSIIAGAIGVLVALVSGGLTTGLLALVLIVGVQQLEGHVLAPYVLGRGLDVHPLVVLLAVMLGAAILGPFGALIGVPLAASMYQAVRYVNDEAT